MIGRTVRSRRVSVLGAVLLLGIGLGVAAAGPPTGTTWPSVAAVLPLALGIAFLVMGSERPFSATFTADAIEIDDSPSSIRYDQIRYVWANGLAHDPGSFSKSSSVIHVEHDGGMIRIPGRLDHPSSQVYTFLASQVPLRGGRAVNSRWRSISNGKNRTADPTRSGLTPCQPTGAAGSGPATADRLRGPHDRRRWVVGPGPLRQGGTRLGHRGCYCSHRRWA